MKNFDYKYKPITTTEKLKETIDTLVSQEMEEISKSLSTLMEKRLEAYTTGCIFLEKNLDDYFGDFTEEEYVKVTKEYFEYLKQMSKIDYDKSESLINRYKDNLFATEFVSDEEAEILYHTILNWKEKADMYDLCDYVKLDTRKEIK